MITNKCHSCGYYFNGSAMRSCPRCSQGFSGGIDEHFTSGDSGELGKGIQSKGLRVVASVVAVIAIGAVVSSTQHSNSYSSDSTSSSSDQSNVVNDSSSSDNSSWIPSGFEAFDSNADIAQDPNYQAGNCQNSNSNSTSGYCWQFQIVTKSDCQVVTATLDLYNSGSSIGQVTGEVESTSSGVPATLEIDAYDNADVDDSTTGSISNITCTRSSTGAPSKSPRPLPSDASGSIGNQNSDSSNSSTDSQNNNDASGSIGN